MNQFFMKTIIGFACSAALLVASFNAAAEHHEDASSGHTFSANVLIATEYLYRGITQTNEDPTIQGGMDYAHSSGFYAGTWAS
ncbi:MAG: hypothetical protein HOB02_06780, partial [Proteobacteria bacterium]|nr:hypothetical protein [Pseudomonadota bacterium]